MKPIWVLGWIWWWPWNFPFDRGTKAPPWGPWRCTTVVFEGFHSTGWWFTWYHRSVRQALLDFRERVLGLEEPVDPRCFTYSASTLNTPTTTSSNTNIFTYILTGGNVRSL